MAYSKKQVDAASGAPNAGMLLHTYEEFNGTLGTLTAYNLSAGTPSVIGTAVGGGGGVYSLTQRDSCVTWQPEPAVYGAFGKTYVMPTNFVAWAVVGGCIDETISADEAYLGLGVSTANGGTPTVNDYFFISALYTSSNLQAGLSYKINGAASVNILTSVYNAPWGGCIVGIIKQGTTYSAFFGHPGGQFMRFGPLSAPSWGTAPNNIGVCGYATAGDNIFCCNRFRIFEGTGFVPF